MRRLAPNVVASVLTAVTLIATALVSVPLILHDAGLAGYGAWTLGQTLLVYITTAEAGIGPAVQRFVAVGRGAGEHDTPARLLWSSLGLYVTAGVLIALVAQPLAGLAADALGLHGALRADAVTLYRLVGVAVALSLMASAFGNVQQGLERFVGYAVSAVSGSVVFLVALIVLLGAGKGLPGIGVAAIIQQGTIMVVRAAGVRDLLLTRPRLASSAERRAVLGFAARLQVTVLSLLVNTQTDKLVVGAVASSATLGQLGIGSQVAESGRLVGGAALSPIISRLATAHGSAEPEALVALFARLNRIWMVIVVGATVIGGATLYPLIRGWLGTGHGEAAELGAFLVVAFGVSLTTGPAIAYLRAVGRPTLEARYGLFLVAVNVSLTVVLGFAFGAYGVVGATTAAYVIGTTWFFRQLHGAAPELRHVRLLPPAADAVVAVVAGAAACAFGLAMVALLPSGLALIPVAAGMAAAFVAYLARATGVRPTPGGVRQALAGA